MLTILQEQENYTVYELTFQRDGLQIYGNLYLPRSDAPSFPTVMIGHGFGGSYSEMAFYAAVLAENGIAGYVFDFCGGSSLRGEERTDDVRGMVMLYPALVIPDDERDE